MHIYDYFINSYDEFIELNVKLKNAYFTQPNQNYNQSNYTSQNQSSVPHPTEHIPHPTEHIPHPTEHIPHPTEHIPHPTEHIPHQTEHMHQEQMNEKNTNESNEENKSVQNNWLRKIYLKLLFIYHPDKNIKPNNIYFTNLKNEFEKDIYHSLFYYFIKERDHPNIQPYFNEISKTEKFQKSLENMTNLILHQINQIKNNPLLSP